MADVLEFIKVINETQNKSTGETTSFTEKTPAEQVVLLKHLVMQLELKMTEDGTTTEELIALGDVISKVEDMITSMTPDEEAAETDVEVIETTVVEEEVKTFEEKAEPVLVCTPEVNTDEEEAPLAGVTPEEAASEAA